MASQSTSKAAEERDAAEIKKALATGASAKEANLSSRAFMNLLSVSYAYHFF